MVTSRRWVWVLSFVAAAACSKDEDPIDEATGGQPGAAGGSSSGAATSTGGAGIGAAAPMGGTKATGGTASPPVAGAGGTAGAVNAPGPGGTSAGNGTGGSNDAGAATGGAVGGAAAGGVTAGGIAGNAAGGVANVSDTVTRKTSSYEFKHFAVETNSDGVWNGPESPAGQPIETSYDTTILENGFLRVTILPSYGGRILSIVHKPTNRELLYQNPIGTPYLMQQDIFYYDYLVILGGIFPSFPEPEHGKYWNQPYEFEVVSESPEAITVRMSRKDDRDRVAGIPERYDVGRTDVLVQLEVTLRAGSAALELNTKLTNTRSSAVPSFEYWTVTTLAPGSTPGQTSIPLDTRILAKMDKVRLLEESWDWFANAETRVSGDVFEWKNLVFLKNWTREGTAFANPQYSANWSGLANDVNGTNILRVSENLLTPGLKLWSFGKGGLDIDVNDGAEWLRPAIEMWHGVTPEFWKRATLAANEVRTWTDRYFATVGLKEITAASENGALYLSAAPAGSDTALHVAASLTAPNRTVKAILRVNGKVISEKDVVAAAAEATTVSANVPSSDAPAGAVFEAEFLQDGKSLVKGQITLN
jgi:hypothetical protein